LISTAILSVLIAWVEPPDARASEGGPPQQTNSPEAGRSDHIVDLQRRGKQLRNTIDAIYANPGARKVAPNTPGGVNITSTFRDAIPAGTSAQDAEAMLTYAGFTMTKSPAVAGEGGRSIQQIDGQIKPYDKGFLSYATAVYVVVRIIDDGHDQQVSDIVGRIVKAAL